jgi:hypothetical protein
MPQVVIFWSAGVSIQGFRGIWVWILIAGVDTFNPWEVKLRLNGFK